MPTCDLCEERTEKLYLCKECESRFCSNCGDIAILVCEYCQEEDEEWDEEEEDLEEDWLEDEP
ncbi:MAG: hypothetical protein GWN64_13125 [Candidatus Thorarchaeota archaeon]|nr:hypothetical protein [Candidatus Thorarchaeota archaeon]